MDPLFLAFQQAVAGRYSLDREIGRGGMGVVYLAREVHLDRPVAIKLLPPERASQRTLRDRFLREARLAAKLSHPNIIPIHSVEDIGGFVFFVMAFVDGETLAQRVRSRGPLPSSEGTRVLREAAWALAHAHSQGLVHRDVKPDNILLEGTTGRVLVADFGIAAAQSDTTADGISGTPEFMSPEQALGTALDARSDLYSLGATAYYAFSGRFPFEGKSATEVLAKQVTEQAPSLSSLGLTVPRKLAALIDRCLAKAPDHRPESALVLAEHLGVALERRREMPPALRAFARTNSRLNGPGTLLGAGFLSVATTITGILAFNSVSVAAPIFFGAFVAVGLVAPFVAFVDAAKDLLNQGFGHRDAITAYDAAMESAREEMVVGQTKQFRIRGVLGGVAAASTSVVAVVILGELSSDFGSWALRTFGGAWVMGFNMFAGLCAVLALTTGMGYAVLKDKEEPEGTFWARLWKGRIGRAAFGIAARFAKPQTISALTHRATELSLGMAAEQLFDSLPKATRKHLGDLPTTLKHLQAAAQELRKRHESLVEALADAGDAASGAEYADVREMRDSLHDRLRETVGALETIRLNLLRLHAGSASVESVTTHLNIAAEVSEEVERLIAAHSDVERSLKFPRTPATTPV
jgi:hypothetical protein